MLQECMKLKPNQKAEYPYSDGLRLGDFLWISGQYPVDPETGKIAGNTIQEQTEQAMQNICTVLKSYDLSTDYLMRMTIYMTDVSLYDEMNEVYGGFFGDSYPTRSVIGVSALPHGAMIEIEGYALDTRAMEVLCSEDCCEDENGCCGKDVCE